MYSAHEITGGFAPKKVLKYYGHKCFEGLSYKGMQKYLCKSYICSLNLYVFLNVFAVEAYVASWIEIFARCKIRFASVRRGLRSLVD